MQDLVLSFFEQRKKHGGLRNVYIWRSIWFRWYDIWHYILVNCSWVDTRWQ